MTIPVCTLRDAQLHIALYSTCECATVQLQKLREVQTGLMIDKTNVNDRLRLATMILLAFGVSFMRQESEITLSPIFSRNFIFKNKKKRFVSTYHYIFSWML